MWLVHVKLPCACFGFEVTDDGWVIQAAPIADWTIPSSGAKRSATTGSGAGQVSSRRCRTGSATPADRVPARSALLGPRACDQEHGGAECNGDRGEGRQRQQVRGSGER